MPVFDRNGPWMDRRSLLKVGGALGGVSVSGGYVSAASNPIDSADEIEIIDAQIHQPAPWLKESENDIEGEFRLATEITLAYMDAAGVDRAVISTNNIKWGEYAATSFPDRLAVTPSNVIDVKAPDLDQQFAELKKKPGVIGYRQSIAYPPDAVDKMKSGAFEPVFKACSKIDLPLMVLVSGALPLAESIARSHPNLSLIIDHFGIPQPPVLQEADTPPWKSLPQLLNLARYENVTVKFSGAPTLSAQPYPFEDLWPHLNQVVDAFGPNRLMWGADITRVAGRTAHRAVQVDYAGRHSYAEAVGFLRDTHRLSQSDKEQIFSGTLRRVLGWPKV